VGPSAGMDVPCIIAELSLRVLLHAVESVLWLRTERSDLGRFGSIGKVLSGPLLSAKFITVSLPAVGLTQLQTVHQRDSLYYFSEFQ
jgi:hypothetical protein